MTLPVWVPGQVLSASDINRWFVPNLKTKPSDQSATSSTTLVNDNDLQVAVEASATYTFIYSLYQTAVSGGDFKAQLTAPAGASLFSGLFVQNGANTSRFAFSSPVTITGAGFVVPNLWVGTIVTGVTAGTVILQWAQGTSNASPTTVKAGSSVSFVRSA